MAFPAATAAISTAAAADEDDVRAAPPRSRRRLRKRRGPLATALVAAAGTAALLALAAAPPVFLCSARLAHHVAAWEQTLAGRSPLGPWRRGEPGGALSARHAEASTRRCPGCGKAWKAGCDGQGRLQGGAGIVGDWSPVHAYKKCPNYRGAYTPTGFTGKLVFDQSTQQGLEQEMLLVPATWRSLTKIRLREYADVKADATGDVVGPYEKFKVVDVVRVGKQRFLKVEGKNGWAFDKGVVGRWAGRPICERVDGPKV